MQHTRKKASVGPALAAALALAVLAAGCTIDIQNKKGADPCDPNPCEKQGACAQWTATCTVKSGAPICSSWKPAAGAKPVGADGEALSAPVDYEAVETRCDGIDNDCDGLVDEGLTGDPAKVCGGDKGACAGVSPAIACVGGSWRCDYSAAPAWEATETTCDGVDNDCDGLTDEDENLVPPATACKRAGVCAGLAAPTCGGDEGWDCHYDAATDYEEATETTCDGKDNNCDGLVDNVGALSGGGSCKSAGVCEAGVPVVCLGGEPTCDYAALPGWQAFESKCDGLDNDCDGETDNVPGTKAPLFDTDTATCKAKGACEASKGAIVRRCEGGELACDYGAVLHFEVTETLCDGVDNDCDGQTDNALPPPATSPCGDKGLCASGKPVCVDGIWACNWSELAGQGYEPFEVSCDDKDNDCDGETDALSASVVSPGCKSKGVCAWGVASGCDKGALSCDYSHVLAYEESTETTCDGKDNDCDGEVDEPAGLDDKASGCVLGVCAGVAKATCASGKWQCAFEGVKGYESTELSCDGLDNDCDGKTDEELSSTVAAKCLSKGVCAEGVTASCTKGLWTCHYALAFQQNELSCDGLDNDCDGKTDEAVCAAGQSCTEDAVCASGHCAPLFGAGAGSVCGDKAGQCALSGGSGGATLHDSGAKACVDGGSTAKCAAGKWGAATKCPELQPACVDGACLKCVPGALTCDFTKTKVMQCNAKGDDTALVKTCASTERCLGKGACVVDGAIAVASGVSSLERPAVARLGEGFVIAWSGAGVQARIFDATGKGGAVITVTDQSKPLEGQRIAVTAAGGGFAVGWVVDNPGTARDVVVRFFDAKGTAITGEVEANTDQAQNQDDVAIAGNADGAVVVWTSGTGDSSGKSIRGQRFNKSGQKAGGELLLNKAVDAKDGAEAGDEYGPAVSMRSDGRFAVAWTHKPTGDSTTAIVGRVYSKAAAPMTGNLELSSGGNDKRRDVSVAWAGEVLLGAWVLEDFTDGAEIVVRRFDAKLEALGKGVRANTLAKGDQLAPAVAGTDKGAGTVVWTTSAAASAGSMTDVASRDVLAGGALAPATAEALVTSAKLSGGEQLTPAVAVWDDGRVLVSWRDSLTAQSKGSIKATFR